MPLHDWTDRRGWGGLHTYWMTEIGRDLKAKLPPGYRAVIGPSPFVAIDLAQVEPDVAVTQAATRPPPVSDGEAGEPEVEVAVATLEEDMTVQVVQEERLVAVVELVSPRNKDRPASRAHYASRYLNYLRGGVHLLLVDVHRRPIGFGFPAMIAAALGEPLPAPPAPSVVSYRMGAAAARGGRMVGLWQRPLVVGDPLPTMRLALTPDEAVAVDLDGTYIRAASDSYVV